MGHEGIRAARRATTSSGSPRSGASPWCSSWPAMYWRTFSHA